MKKTAIVLLVFVILGLILNYILGGFSFNTLTLFFQKPDRFQSLLNPYYYSILILMGINIILSVSLCLINGLTGMFTMGHAGFMAIGAYCSASVVMFLFPNSNSFVQMSMGMLAAGLGAGFFGLILSFSVLRLSGDYLGMVTLGFGEIIRIAILNIDKVGGARGMTDVPQFVNLGGVFFWSLFTVLVIKHLRDSRYGRAMIAIKENEMAATFMGISSFQVKVKSFVLSSFFAGIAGSLFAHSQGYLSTQTFSFVKSFEVIAMNVLGGLGSISGSIIGAVVLTILPEGLRKVQDFIGVDIRMLIYALSIILIMILRPQGMMGTKEWKWLSSK